MKYQSYEDRFLRLLEFKRNPKMLGKPNRSRSYKPGKSSVLRAKDARNKKIDGVDWRECTDCGNWFILRENFRRQTDLGWDSKCTSCRKLYDNDRAKRRLKFRLEKDL